MARRGERRVGVTAKALASAFGFLAFLALPFYMLHQYEEHENDRFRLLLNRTLGAGRETLTLWDVFVINVPIVWGLIALSFVLTATVSAGFGLLAIYLLLVNAIAHTAHTAHAVLFRMYNPGLGTAPRALLPARHVRAAHAER